MKRFILVSLMALCLPMALPAQESPALPFLAIDRNPVTLATGAAQATSILYNPAAAPLLGSDIAFSFQSWAPQAVKSTHLNLMGGIKQGRTMGLQFMGAYQSGAEYTVTDASGNIGDPFKPSDLLLGVGIGFSFSKTFSGGVSVKLASSSLSPEDKATSIAADVFVMYAKGGFKASAGVANLGTPVKSGETSYGIPASAKAGAAYQLPFGTSAVEFKADFDYFFTGGIGLGAGAQYAWNDTVFVRAGYHLGGQKAPIPSFASVGLGVKFVGIHIDACYLLASEALGNTLSIGVGFAF